MLPSAQLLPTFSFVYFLKPAGSICQWMMRSVCNLLTPLTYHGHPACRNQGHATATHQHTKTKYKDSTFYFNATRNAESKSIHCESKLPNTQTMIQIAPKPQTINADPRTQNVHLKANANAKCKCQMQMHRLPVPMMAIDGGSNQPNTSNNTNIKSSKLKTTTSTLLPQRQQTCSQQKGSTDRYAHSNKQTNKNEGTNKLNELYCTNKQTPKAVSRVSSLCSIATLFNTGKMWSSTARRFMTRRFWSGRLGIAA